MIELSIGNEKHSLPLCAYVVGFESHIFCFSLSKVSCLWKPWEDATETYILWNVSILVTSVTAIDIPMVDWYMVDDFVCGFDTICIVSDGINATLTLGTVKSNTLISLKNIQLPVSSIQ